MANTSIEVVLGMVFLVLSNADVLFADKDLIWRISSPNKTLLTIKHVQIID